MRVGISKQQDQWKADHFSKTLGQKNWDHVKDDKARDAYVVDDEKTLAMNQALRDGQPMNAKAQKIENIE
jgi:hypothetical protein